MRFLGTFLSALLLLTPLTALRADSLSEAVVGEGGASPDPNPPPPEQPPPPDAVVPLRLDAGAVVPFTDGASAVWDVDQWAVNGNIASYGAQAIAGTTDDTLYQTERWFAGNLEYRIRIANGTYDLTTCHAENVFNAAAARVFDVLAQGVEVISNFDPYVAAGNAKNTAVCDTAEDIVVFNGELSIIYRQQTQNPQVNAILITLAEPDAPPPPAPSCSPATQSVVTGATASFTAADGDGFFSWSALGGTPNSGSGSTFETTYSTPGVKTVNVISAELQATCTVSVSVPPTFPELLASDTTSIETVSAAAPAFRAAFTACGDIATPDPQDTCATTGAVGDTLLVAVTFRHGQANSTAAVSSVSVGSQAATLIKACTDDNASVRRAVEWWGVLSNTAINPTITVNYNTNTNQSAVLGFAYTGVDSFGATACATPGSASTWAVSVVSGRANSKLVAAGVIGDGSGDPFAVADTETERQDGSTAGTGTNHLAYHVVDFEKAAAGTESLGGTGSTSGRVVASGIELRSALGVASAVDLPSDPDAGSGDDYYIAGCSGDVANITTPAGWTPVTGLNGVFLPDNAGRLWLWHRIATSTWPGSETTVPFSQAADQETAWVSFILEGHRSSTTIPHGAQNGGATTATPNPPLLNTSSGVAENMLAIELFAADETSNTSPYVSSGYTAIAQAESSATAGSCGINVGYKEVSGPFEDPAVMANGASEQTVAATMFVYSGDEGEGAAPVPPPSCLPVSQTVDTNEAAQFTVTDGDGTYAWSAPGGSTPTGSGTSFSTTYATTGNKTVTVTSAGQSDQCLVAVQTPPVGGGPGVTDDWVVWIDGKIYSPAGVVTNLHGFNLLAQSDSASVDDFLESPGWNSNAVRLNDITRSSDGSIPSNVTASIDNYRDTEVVIVGYHIIDGVPVPGGIPASGPDDKTPCGTDQNIPGCPTEVLTDYYVNISDAYRANSGNPGADPDPDVWMYLYNEPSSAGPSISGSDCTWNTGPSSNFTKLMNYIGAASTAVRNSGYRGPLIIPAQGSGGANDTCSPNFNHGAAHALPLAEMSWMLTFDSTVRARVPNITVNGQSIDNICYDMHLYHAYNNTDWAQDLIDLHNELRSRGICVLFGEFGMGLRNAAGSFISTVNSTLNLQTLFNSRGGDVNSFPWSGNGTDPNNLTTTAPVTGNQFGIRDVACPSGNCTVDDTPGPTNLTDPSGEFSWGRTH